MQLRQFNDKIITKISLNRLLTFSIFNLVLMIFGLADIYFFEEKSSSQLISFFGPNFFFLIGYPHIFASFLTCFHNNYFQHYRKDFLLNTLPVFILTIIIFFINFNLYKILFCLLISYHISGQGLGVAKIFLTDRKKYFEIWKYVHTVLLFIGFVKMYASDVWLATRFINLYLSELILIVSLISIFITLLVYFNQSNFRQKILVLVMQMQFLGIAFFCTKNNFLYWGLMIIIVHDVVAFTFYLNHEKNAIVSGDFNRSFLLYSKSIISLFLISILLSYSIINFLNFFSIPYLMFSFQITHYLIESMIWKVGTIHRKRINFSW